MGEGKSAEPPRRIGAGRGVLAGALLGLPFVVFLWVPSYATVTPALGGFPFFYWWQLLWVVLTAACIGGALVLTGSGRRK